MARKKAPLPKSWPPKDWPAGAVFTVGHSTLSIEDFVALLRAYGIETLVDIRTVPRSRHNPQFNADALPQALAAHGVEYVGMQGLGGLRKTSKESFGETTRCVMQFAHRNVLLVPEGLFAAPRLGRRSRRERPH